MPNDDLQNEQEKGKNKPSEDPATRRGWKSKWVESINPPPLTKFPEKTGPEIATDEPKGI